jgi:hypothetical protein
MPEILNILPPDILQVETPHDIHQKEAVVPAKPDDNGTNPAVIDALFSEKSEKAEKPEEITPAMAYALWSAAAILGDKARLHLQRRREEDERELEEEEESERPIKQ